RVLPGHPAGAGTDRNAETPAKLHHRSRARQKGRQWRGCRIRGCVTRSPRLSGETERIRDMKKLLASIVPFALAGIIGVGPAFAAEEGGTPHYPINKPREV